MSVGGMFIETRQPLMDGDRAFFKIEIPQHQIHFHLEGEVVWGQRRRNSRYRPKRGMGIRFLSTPTQNAKTIEGIFSIP